MTEPSAPPPATPATPPPPGRSRRPLIVVAVVGAVVALVCCAGAATAVVLATRSGKVRPAAAASPSPSRSEYAPGAGTAAPLPTTREHQVTYKVTGQGAVNITFDNDGSAGGVAQEANVALPWSKTFSIAQPVIQVYVSAQRQAGDGGSVTCEILIDGVQQKTATSTGAFVIASCSGLYRA